MKPLLALHITHPDIEPDYVADLLNAALDREFGRTGAELVSVRTLATPEELRAYMAGEMVLYRKPARRRGNKITYQRDGIEHHLEQTTAFGE